MEPNSAEACVLPRDRAFVVQLTAQAAGTPVPVVAPPAAEPQSAGNQARFVVDGQEFRFSTPGIRRSRCSISHAHAPQVIPSSSSAAWRRDASGACVKVCCTSGMS